MVKLGKDANPEGEWLYAPEIQEEVRQALDEMKEGKSGPVLRTHEEIATYLDRLKK